MRTTKTAGCTDARAVLSLRWVHMSEGTFSHAVAQILLRVHATSFVFSKIKSALELFTESFLVLNTAMR